MLRPLVADGGIFGAEQVEQAVRPIDRHQPRSRLVSVEQTTNMGGGRVWPQERLREVVAVARRRRLRTHMDGARLMNAVVASGVPAARHADGFDTAWIDFTKGLGAGVGACMAASKELIDEAWRYKQMWGGAFRQSGVIAAAGLYALDHNVERLADDHENARVIFSVPDPAGLLAKLEGQVELSMVDNGNALRAVTHMDVSRPDIDAALAAIRTGLAG